MRLDSFKLKVLALLLMVMDHLHYAFYTPIWFNWIGRVVAPIFFFISVEGFFHTRNKKRYIARLFLAGFIMLAGNIVVSKVLLHNEVRINNSIFLSLALSSLFIYILEWMKESKKYFLGSLLCILIAGASILTEASILGIPMTLVFYYFRKNKTTMSIAFTAVSLLICIGLVAIQPGGLNLRVLFLEQFQWMMIFSLPFIWAYNGVKGRSAKYLFYLFYPLHIWALHILGFYIN